MMLDNWKNFRYFIFALFIFLQIPYLQAQVLSLQLKDKVYANNLEYVGAVDRFREGETFFGNIFASSARLGFLENHFFNFGILARLPFGSSKIIDPFGPLISLESHFWEKKARLIAGSIENPHRSSEAIIDNTLFYVRPIEYGLQGIVDFENAQGELWINWQRMESFTQNEKFDTGGAGKLEWKNFFAKGEWHYIHVGGQLFNNPDPVQDDHAFAIGAGYSQPLAGIKKIQLSATRFFSSFTIRKFHFFHRRGQGSEFKILISPWDLDISGSYWKGKDFSHEDGDPLYKAGKYIQWGLQKNFKISEKFNIALDARLKFVDGTMAHTEGILFSWDLAYPINL